VRFSVAAPEGLRSVGSPKISPDGRMIAFSATDTTGKRQLWVRALDSEEPRPLTGTDDAGRPFWSPDSRFLAFFADGKLKKIAIAGGPSQTICDAPGGADGSWGREGTILFDGSTTDSLRKVSAAGGSPSAATSIDERRPDRPPWPTFYRTAALYIAMANTPEQGA
jgi:serine/threonine-protein kinase